MGSVSVSGRVRREGAGSVQGGRIGCSSISIDDAIPKRQSSGKGSPRDGGFIRGSKFGIT